MLIQAYHNKHFSALCAVSECRIILTGTQKQKSEIGKPANIPPRRGKEPLGPDKALHGTALFCGRDPGGAGWAGPRCPVPDPAPVRSPSRSAVPGPRVPPPCPGGACGRFSRRAAGPGPPPGTVPGWPCGQVAQRFSPFFCFSVAIFSAAAL